MKDSEHSLVLTCTLPFAFALVLTLDLTLTLALCLEVLGGLCKRVNMHSTWVWLSCACKPLKKLSSQMMFYNQANSSISCNRASRHFKEP